MGRIVDATKSIGFVILTWNSEKYIGTCIDAVHRIRNYKIRIIIVDNGSKDATISEIKERIDEKVELICLGVNRGTTVSRNIGIRRVLNCDFICILDSDTVINQEAVEGLIKSLDENEKNAITGPKMVNKRGIVQNTGRKVPTMTEKVLKIIPIKMARRKAESLEYYSDIFEVKSRAVGYLISACWMIKSSVIKEIGFLDENIFYAPEDVEYCLRAWKYGYRVIYCGNIQIVHEWQRLSRKKIFSRHNYEHIKGLIYLYRKYHFWFNSKKIEANVK